MSRLVQPSSSQQTERILMYDRLHCRIDPSVASISFVSLSRLDSQRHVELIFVSPPSLLHSTNKKSKSKKKEPVRDPWCSPWRYHAAAWVNNPYMTKSVSVVLPRLVLFVSSGSIALLNRHHLQAAMRVFKLTEEELLTVPLVSKVRLPSLFAEFDAS